MQTTRIGRLGGSKHIDIPLSGCVVSKKDLAHVLKVAWPLCGKRATVWELETAVGIMGDMPLAHCLPDNVPKESLVLVVPSFLPVLLNPLVYQLPHALYLNNVWKIRQAGADRCLSCSIVIMMHSDIPKFNADMPG